MSTLQSIQTYSKTDFTVIYLNGNIYFRYRKFNPYNENVEKTAVPEIVTFRTDFNVTFGVIVCFDLILDVPANILLARGIRNFIFSTLWHSQLPYATGKC